MRGRAGERTKAYSVAEQGMRRARSIRGAQAKRKERSGGAMAPDRAGKVQQTLGKLAEESARFRANIFRRGEIGRHLAADE
eukprot:8046322-Pyramimonas_sp.AAC.1